jgi:hypothetical protein
VWEQAREGRVPSATERNPAIPPGPAQILDRALATDPAKRHQSAGEFGRDLRGYLRRPVWRVAALVAGVALLGVGGCVIAQMRKGGDDPPPTGPKPGPVLAAETPELAPRPRLAGWRVYRSPEGYAVHFPSEPKLSVAKAEPMMFPIRNAQARDPATGTSFAIAVGPQATPAATPQASLRARRDEVLKFVNASLTGEREISLDGHPGADATAFVSEGHFQGYWVRLRVFLVRDQFYALAVMGRAPHRAEDIEADWFFESFRLLPHGD